MKKKNKEGRTLTLYPEIARAIQLEMVLQFPLLAGCFVTVHREPWGMIVYKLQAVGVEMVEYLERINATPQLQGVWREAVRKHGKALINPKDGGRVS